METKIGLVPRAIVTGVTGSVREYGILITDKRSIFVLEKGVSGWARSVGGGAFGVVGYLTASAVATRNNFDYFNASPDELARMKKSISINHEQVRGLRVKKGLWGSAPRLLIEYDDSDGKRRKLKARLEPPGELMKQKKEGMGRKEALLEYGTKVKEAYEKSLPPTQSILVEWQL